MFIFVFFKLFIFKYSLRKVKLDQRKLNDNVNTLIDLAKVITKINLIGSIIKFKRKYFSI